MIKGANFWCSNLKGMETLCLSCPKIVAVCMFTRWVDIETKTMSNDCIDNYRSRKLELGFCCCDLHQALSSGSSLAVPQLLSGAVSFCVGRACGRLKEFKSQVVSSRRNLTIDFRQQFTPCGFRVARVLSSKWKILLCSSRTRRGLLFAVDNKVTWLILPVVICLSQRLSHACLSINNFIL